MKTQWMYRNKKVKDSEYLAKKFNISPYILKVLADRGIEGETNVQEYLEADINAIPSGEDMTDMKKGVSIIADAVRNKKKLRIAGDYDADGITSTYVLYKGLLGLGMPKDKLSYYIPHRIHDGYGLHASAIEKCKEDGIEVLLTCDNGISARNEIKLAKEYGMTVVITDHHETPYIQNESGEKEYIIPAADAVIDPKRPEDMENGVFAEICGAVVAFKFMKLLYHEFDMDDAFDNSDFLEIVSIGTVCDVMTLLHENRAIVKEGLKRCRNTSNIGLQALLEVLGMKDAELKSYDYGFKIGPCINAEGRLDTAEESLKLLLESDYDNALKQAESMRDMNNTRQELTREGTEEAFKIIDESMKDDKVIVVYLPNLHESIAGIVAGKVREKYNKPAFVLTNSNDIIKGSGRSIEQFSMYDELVKVKDLLLGFGGHPLAAGLSLKPENLNELRKQLNDNCTLTDEDFVKKTIIDVIMPVELLTQNFIKQLAVLEPFGKGNEKPVFAQQHVAASSANIIGKNKNVLKLNLLYRNCKSAVCFHDVDELHATVKGKLSDFNIIYYPTLNEWNGNVSIQANVQDIH